MLGHQLDLGARCGMAAPLRTLKGSLDSLNPQGPDAPFPSAPVPGNPFPRTNAQKFYCTAARPNSLPCAHPLGPACSLRQFRLPLLTQVTQISNVD